ncbi:BQ5605_C022g09506 [Microbotryum silenes-dioicae]|uniref:BQ5605_C022g09506 protein n=1 Tax=Microbotryum silenes-dioicae TaxID=796604 RepID=A0A2X0PLB1_9BASI|nr:BQ5605_C022g09506 [Microbotryum silenes-dioicae]
MMPPHPFELFVPYSTTERDRPGRRCTLPPPPVFDTTSSPPPASASAAAFLSPPQRTRPRKKRIPLYQLRASGSSKMTRVTKPFIHYKQYSDTFYTLWHSSRESPADRDERAEPAHPSGKENGAASPHISPALPRSPAPLYRAPKKENHNMITSSSSTPCTSSSSSSTSCMSSSPSAAGSTALRSRSASNESSFFRSEWQDTDARAFHTSFGPHQCSEYPMRPLSSTSSSSLSSLPTSSEGGSEEEDEEDPEENGEEDEEDDEEDAEEDEEEDERLDQFTNFVLGGLRAIPYEDISKRARTVASLKRKRGGFLVGVEVALS